MADAEQIAEVCRIRQKETSVLISCSISPASTTTATTRAGRSSITFTASRTHCHLRLTTSVGEEKSELPTVTTIWRTADWHEREIYDMMGIRFAGHPDLRRIIMWEGYPYFTLRKDFPLAGKPSPKCPRSPSARPRPWQADRL